MNVIQKVRVM